MNHFAQAIDNLDAEVFTGDALTSKHNRDVFRSHLERWARGLKEHDDLAAAETVKVSGCFRIEVRGKSKWTPLRPTRQMYYGKYYPLTKEQAHENAKFELIDAKKKYSRELRINCLEKS